eukprot:4977744-Prymnesium_polylepis.1
MLDEEARQAHGGAVQVEADRSGGGAALADGASRAAMAHAVASLVGSIRAGPARVSHGPAYFSFPWGSR